MQRRQLSLPVISSQSFPTDYELAKAVTDYKDLLNSKPGEKKYFEATTVQVDEHGNERQVGSVFINRAYFNHLTNHRPISERLRQEEEARKIHRINEFARSKAISKGWPDSIENIKKAEKAAELERTRREKEERDERYRQMAWENRATDRKILADAEIMRWNERPEVRELHGAYILSQTLHEVDAQIECKKKLRCIREEQGKLDAERREAAEKLKWEEVEREAEGKAKRNQKHWEKINEQVKERQQAREEEKREKLIKDLETHDMIRSEMREGKEEMVKKEKMERLLRGLKAAKEDKEWLRGWKEQDEEQLQRDIEVHKDAVRNLKEATEGKNKDHFIPGAAARKKVQKEAWQTWERITKEKNEKLERIFKSGEKDLVAKEEERIAEDIRKEREGKAHFLSVNDGLQQKKLQKKCDMQKMKNMERLQHLRLSEVEKERQRTKHNEYKNKQALTSAQFKDQTLEKEVIKKLDKEETLKFIEAEKVVRDESDSKFIKFATEVVKGLKSEGRNIKPLEKVIKKYCERSNNMVVNQDHKSGNN